jgi:hypothetical protein
MVSAMTSEPSGPARHIDHGRWLAQFAGRILVVCPRCAGRALVVLRPDLEAPRYLSQLMFMPRRLVCAACGAVGEWEARVRGTAPVGVALGGTEDPFFRQPLWLQTRCVGHILWAYNEQHIDELAAYVGAVLRERDASPTMAMFARLPVWMKRADNRAEVLAGLGRLRALAERSAPDERSDAAHPRDGRPRIRGGVYLR